MILGNSCGKSCCTCSNSVLSFATASGLDVGSRGNFLEAHCFVFLEVTQIQFLRLRAVCCVSALVAHVDTVSLWSCGVESAVSVFALVWSLSPRCIAVRFAGDALILFDSALMRLHSSLCVSFEMFGFVGHSLIPFLWVVRSFLGAPQVLHSFFRAFICTVSHC